jgi:membrane protease YdiL (CAAX protease family)
MGIQHHRQRRSGPLGQVAFGPGGHRRRGRRGPAPVALRPVRNARAGSMAARRLHRARRRWLKRRLARAARTRIWLAVECGLLFVGLPSALWLGRVLGLRLPIVPTLLVVTGAIGLRLARDPYFDRRVLRAWRGLRIEGRRILTTFALLASLLTLLVAGLTPERLFDMPRQQTTLWAGLMVFYPLFSVFPQELIYRAFFFHRYRTLFANRRLTLLASSLAFGFVHVLYGAWISVALTTVGGLLFGFTYLRTRSILLVGFEHALYGCFMFTVGLGHFFYRAL